MSRCSSCGNHWPAQLRVCPQDGTSLPDAVAQAAAGEPKVQVAPAAATVSLEPGTTVGEYQIESKLAEGGMAEIYEAVQPLIGKRVAIKVIRPLLGADEHSVLRFIQEARTVVQIGHPNIVDVFSFGQLPDGRTYFVMEWLQGETLAQRIARGLVPSVEAIEIIEQICDALDAAHEKGVIHRDLKPENVVLLPPRGGRLGVKLLDFGIAKLHPNSTVADFALARTQNDLILGTPQYISPEQARGREVDRNADAYSLGVIAFEMVTGRLPFLADNAMDMVRHHMTEMPPRARMINPDVPQLLDDVIAALLEKEPDRRPALAEVRRRLGDRRLLELAAEIRPPARGGRKLALASVIVILAGALGWMLIHRSPTVTASAAPEVRVAPAPPPRPSVEPITPPAPQRSFVQITIDAPNARVELDGKTVAEAVQQAHIPVDEPGEHTLSVTAPGRRPFKKTIVVAAGSTVETAVRLESLRSGKPSRKPHGKDYVIDAFGRAR